MGNVESVTSQDGHSDSAKTQRRSNTLGSQFSLPSIASSLSGWTGLKGQKLLVSLALSACGIIFLLLAVGLLIPGLQLLNGKISKKNRVYI